MGQWIDQNMGVLTTLLLASIAAVVWLVRLEGKVAENIKTSAAGARSVESVETKLSAHLLDSRRHVDPERDERRWSDLERHVNRRFDAIESKLDKIIEG
jgi:hypothetical protein